MATEIVRPAKSGHNCLFELNPNGYTNKELVPKEKEPIGLITRCSCGTLWELKHYHRDYNHWRKAGWWKRYKHRNQGWEGVSHESH